MTVKKASIVGILAILFNAGSLYNVTLAVWSLAILIFSFFLLGDKQSHPAKDMKIFGFIQSFMLLIFLFLSLGTGFLGFYQLWFVVNEHLSSFTVLFVSLAVIGTILYLYLIIQLIRVAFANFKQRG